MHRSGMTWQIASVRRPLALMLMPLLAGAAAAQSPPDLAGSHAPPPACVVLLHGLGRTSLSMLPMAIRLEGAGYVVANINYPSREHPVETLADEALPRGIAQCRQAGASPIHIVTHSMGGILARYYLGANDVPDLGRVVMMGPPNQGSAVADRLRDQAAYRRFNGPAGQQLVTGPDGIAARLGPVEFPLGVLAGNERTAIDSLLSEGIDEPSDGKVTVEEAKVEGMADFRVLPANHTFILSDAETFRQVLHFLREGHFTAEQDGVSPP
jgi:pimeloyl-ACP methyl ester carboxylesterase